MFSRQMVLRALIASLAALVLLPAAAEAKKFDVEPGRGTLQKAIDKARSGDKLVLEKKGRYRGGVLIDKPLTIRGPGDGKKLPIVDGRCDVGFTMLVLDSPVTLKNFKATGASDAEGAQYGGAEVNFIEGGAGSAIGLVMRDTCGVKYGINVFDSDDVLVEDTVGKGYDDASIYVGSIRRPQTTITITGNVAKVNNTGILIEDSDGHGGIIVADNTTSANDNGFTPRGIFLHNADEVEISGNRSDSNSYAGIWLDQSSDGNQVLGNQASGNGLTAQSGTGADLINDGAGNCGSGNSFGTQAGNPLDACPSVARAATGRIARGPSGLRFYDPPRRLPRRGGRAIWARNARGLVPLDGAAWTKNLLYTSTTPDGERIAVSGSVSVPDGRPPRRGWPLISYAHGTTGVADVCAPSRNRADGPAVAYISYVDPQLEEWLDAGYAVARTDYEGLGTPGPHPYLVGASEGRGVVDIARAARRLEPQIGRRFLIAGHSQGGHAALFAAGMAARKAPELRLRGTIAYAPASHIAEQVSLLDLFTDPSPISAYATIIVEGASTASRRVKPSRLLSDPVLGLYPQLEETCLPQLQASNSLGGIAPADVVREGADTAALMRVLRAANPDVASAAPIFLAQGSADATVPSPFTEELRDELDASGNRVRYTLYEGVDHGGIVSAAESDALAWFESRLPAGR